MLCSLNPELGRSRTAVEAFADRLLREWVAANSLPAVAQAAAAVVSNSAAAAVHSAGGDGASAEEEEAAAAAAAEAAVAARALAVDQWAVRRLARLALALRDGNAGGHGRNS